MKKRTHLLVCKYFIKDTDIPKIDKLWLYFGSVKPDLTIMCLLKPHRYNFRFNDVDKLFLKINDSNKNWLFYYRVGVLSHFLADFFTSPHNRKGLKGFCFNHRNYESKLHKIFKNNLYNFSFHCLTDCNVEDYLVSLHTQYLELVDTSVYVDFEYICKMLNTAFLKLVL